MLFHEQEGQERLHQPVKRCWHGLLAHFAVQVLRRRLRREFQTFFDGNGSGLILYPGATQLTPYNSTGFPTLILGA